MLRGSKIIALLLVISSMTHAQQDPQFTHYMYDRLSVNSAVAGAEGKLCATGIFRNQWTNFSDPSLDLQTMLFNIHGPLPVKGLGLGVTVMNDELQVLNNKMAKLHVAYNTQMGKTGRISFGLSWGLFNKSVRNPMWITPSGLPAGNDGAIPQTDQSETAFTDLSFGIYYGGKDLFVGVSSTHLMEYEYSNFSLVEKRHYYVMAGYGVDLNSTFRLLPSVMAKSDVSTTQVDATVRLLWKKTFWAGVAYRLGDAVSPMLGYQKDIPVGFGKQEGKGILRIGYSYDYTLSALTAYQAGTHEIMLNFCVGVSTNEDKAKYRDTWNL